jgi:protocatechuate 3,4-dioxygenase beta subunit
LSSAELNGFVFVPPFRDGKRASDFSLSVSQRMEGLHLQVARPWIVTGRILDEFGEAVVGVSVEASAVWDSSLTYVQMGGSAVTDDRGIYRLVCAPGTYRIVAHGSGKATYYPAASSEHDAATFTAEPGKETAGIDFRLPATQVPVCAGGTANTPPTNGTLVVTGVVLDSLTGTPLRRARVALSGPENPAASVRFRPAPVQCYGTMTDDQGQFSFDGLPAGKYYIAADHNGHLDEGGPPTVLDLGTERPYHVRLKLAPQAVITGRVVDRDGNPVYKAAVSATSGRWGRATLTDDRGQFRIAGLRDGQYIVKAEIDYLGSPPVGLQDGTTAINYGTTYYPGTLNQSAAAPMHAVEGAEIRGLAVQLLATPVLHVAGSVLGATGLKGAMVSMRARDGQDTFAGSGYVSASNGAFAIWRVRPGKYYLEAQYASFQSLPVLVEVTTASVDNIVLEFRRKR